MAWLTCWLLDHQWEPYVFDDRGEWTWRVCLRCFRTEPNPDVPHPEPRT